MLPIGGTLKKNIIATIFIILLFSACEIQQTATLTETATPSHIVTILPTPISSPTLYTEADLSYEEQKQLIENRFISGSKAFETLIKEDGNLEYYDGTWKTLDAMRNLNGEIIPWGESYDMLSEDSKNGILTNIMAGNEKVMDEHIRVFNLKKENEEKAGFDSSNFNVLYVQFFPDNESIRRQKVSNDMGYYEMKGQIVVRNNNKIIVINITTCSNTGIMHTYVRSEQVFSQNHTKLFEQKAFENSFLGISSSDYLIYRFTDLASLADEAVEKNFIDKFQSSNFESFTEKLKTNPNLIGEDLYHIDFFIIFN